VRLSVVVPLVGLAIVWLLCMSRSDTRTWRAVAALAIASVVVFAALQTDGPARLILGLGGALVIGLILLRPGPLASLDMTDRTANGVLNEIEAALDDPSRAVPRDILVLGLFAPPFSIRSSSWRPAGHFYRLILSGRSGLKSDDGQVIDVR
jgi:hypothetical protein